MLNLITETDAFDKFPGREPLGAQISNVGGGACPSVAPAARILTGPKKIQLDM